MLFDKNKFKCRNDVVVCVKSKPVAAPGQRALGFLYNAHSLTEVLDDDVLQWNGLSIFCVLNCQHKVNMAEPVKFALVLSYIGFFLIGANGM